ncbi:MAG: hydroxyacylglutathione hydrolase, partial [Humisphaera sp.]|nr:hydroxyacylglutathione hydrolase [Humisphaera sp.]
MIIAKNTGGIAGTNAYLIGDADSKQAVIFDAPDNTLGPLLDLAVERGLDVMGLWLTHGHFDHIADHLEVTKRFPRARVLIHKLDEPKLESPNSAMFELPFEIAPRSADAHVEDGQVLTLGKFRVEVIHTPGHAPGHVMYYFPDEKILVGGDLVIGGSVGRTDLPDSDHAALEQSIRRVMQLPPDTRLLPGHGDVSTLEIERVTNPYVQEALG